MSPLEWYLGFAAVLATTGLFLYSGTVLRRLLLHDWAGPQALLASLILGLSLMVVVAQALGLVGLLNRPGLIASAGACGLACAVVWRTQTDRIHERPRISCRKMHISLPLALAVGALLLAAYEWLPPTLNSLEAGMYGGDTIWYHMPFSAHFAQTGSITGFLFVDTQYLNWFYPQNSELIHSIFLVLLGSDLISPVVNYFWLALGILAGWCIGKPYGVALPASLSVAFLMSLGVLSDRQPGNAHNDAMVVALILASMALAVKAVGAPHPRAGLMGPLPSPSLIPLAVACLALGLAVGTKLTALAPCLALLIGFIILLGPDRSVRGGTILGLAAFLTGGFWFVRNLVLTGNPLPWISIGPFNKAGELTGREPKALVEYLIDPSIWSEWLGPGFSDRLGPFWLALLLGAMAGLVIGALSRDRLRIVFSLAGAAAFIAYALIPLSAAGPEGTPTAFSVNIRYAAPALAIGFASLAFPPRGVTKGSWVVGVSWFFLLATGLTFLEAGGLGLRGHSPLALLAAFSVLILLPVTMAISWVTGLRAATITTAAAWVLGIALLGAYQEDRYSDFRYSSLSPKYPRQNYPGSILASGIGELNDFARNIDGSKIGLSGSFAQYYQYGLWGNSASNDLEAIGIRLGNGDLRPPRDCQEWIRALSEGNYEYVVTSPPDWSRDPLTFNTATEAGWIGPKTANGLVRKGRFSLWQLDSRSIDPTVCTPQ